MKQKTYRIKPLEWEIESDGSAVYSVFGLISVYYVKDIDDWQFCIPNLSIYESQFKSEKEAKKAAEKWYCNKLKEALIEVNDE